MAICMVARKRAGRLVSWDRRMARLSPWDTSRASRVSFMETMAISAQAKTALRKIRTTCSRIQNAITLMVGSLLVMSSVSYAQNPVNEKEGEEVGDRKGAGRNMGHLDGILLRKHQKIPLLFAHWLI